MWTSFGIFLTAFIGSGCIAFVISLITIAYFKYRETYTERFWTDEDFYNDEDYENDKKLLQAAKE